MKATLTFTLPEDATDHRLALDGPAWWGVVLDMDNYLRNAIKYQNTEAKTPEEAFQQARDMLVGLIEDHSLSLLDYP
jgi:hypothetical protein